MRFNFRKIASVVASAAMIGSTIGVAAAANYPAPFVSGGAADVAIVYGSSAAVSDLSAAIKVQTNLQGGVSSSSSSTSATTSGGDSTSLASSSQALYLNSALNTARTILTKDHLPTLLADGSAYDSSGVEYEYTQTIVPNGGNRKVTFGKSGESIDPALMVDLGYQGKSAPTYNYTLTFTKAINVSSSSVVGTAEINILGTKYVVGANSDSDTLYLYGSGNSVSIDEGDEETITVEGTDHTLQLKGTSGTTTATLVVDGVSRSMTTGSSYKFSGGLEIYVKDVFHATKTGTLSSVELIVGSQTLHFQDGQAIRYGSDDTVILGTNAEISATGGELNSLMISQGAQSSIGDYLESGESYTDRIFPNLVLEFVGPVPALDSTGRDSIVVDTDNSVAVRATFTTDASDTEYSLYYARDADLVSDSTLAKINFANEANESIYTVEGANAQINDYIIVNDNDEGRILQVLSIGSGTSTNDKTVLRDVIDQKDYEFATGVNNATTAARTIGGAEYHAKTNPSNADQALWTVNITWGTGAIAGYEGSVITAFPRVKLMNGEWMAFLTETTVYNTTSYSLPGAYLYSTYKDGSALTYVNTSSGLVTSFGNVNYNVTWSTGTSGTLSKITLGGTDCIFNASYGPAVLIMEEKTLASPNGNAICIPLTRVGSTTVMPAVGVPVFSDGVGSFSTLQSDTYKSQALSLYGALVERDTSSGTNYKVSVSYPDEQMYVDVFFKASEAVIVPGEGGGVAGGNVLIVKDSEVNSVSGKNLIVIGGSCVNTVARKMIDSEATSPICGAAWTSKTNVGAGQYLLKAMESPYNEDKVAVLVAGYEATNTVSAADKLVEGHATDVGTSNIYPITSA
jgi:hypothetical protein